MASTKRFRHGDEELRRVVRCSLRFLGRAMVPKTGHPERVLYRLVREVQ